MPNLFQQYKTRTSVHPTVILLSTMAARRRRTDAAAEHSLLPKLVRAPDFDTCNFYVEAVNPMFDRMRVLLRRLFFIDIDRTRYVSVGFYPSRDYEPLVQFRAVKKNGSTFITLNEQQVNKMAECLPRICDSMCSTEQYVCKDGDFRLNTVGTSGVARLYLDKQYINLKLADLQYFTWFKIR